MARSRVVRIVLAVVVVWYVAVILLWAIQPLSGFIPVGTDYSVNPPDAATVDVECNNLFDSNPGDGGDVPELPQQPEGQPPLALPPDPCATLQADARRAFALDTFVFVLTMVGVVVYSVRRKPKVDALEPV